MAFYEQMIQIGLIYMLSDPILLVGTYLLSEWNMAFYYNIADQVMHVLLQCYFLYQLKDRKSGFTKSVDSVSTLPMDSGRGYKKEWMEIVEKSYFFEEQIDRKSHEFYMAESG